jgi:hypothetical protein
MQTSHTTVVDVGTSHLGNNASDVDMIIDSSCRNLKLIKCGTSIDLESQVSVRHTFSRYVFTH